MSVMRYFLTTDHKVVPVEAKDWVHVTRQRYLRRPCLYMRADGTTVFGLYTWLAFKKQPERRMPAEFKAMALLLGMHL